MADESLHSLEKLRIAADITRALVAQMGELRELREAVQRAEAATAHGGPDQRYDGTVSYRAESKRHKENKKENKAYLADYSCNRSGDKN